MKSTVRHINLIILVDKLVITEKNLLVLLLLRPCN